MFTITATVTPQNDEGTMLLVTVAGHNLSHDLITEVACHALCMDFGLADYELEGRYAITDVEEGCSESMVSFESCDVLADA